MKAWMIIALLLPIAACQQASNTLENSVILGKKNWQAVQQKYWSLYHYEPYQTPRQLAQVRYCYNTDSDIICYHRPQPNRSTELFGYQGPPPEEYLAYLEAQQAESFDSEPVSFLPPDEPIEVIELDSPEAEELAVNTEAVDASGAPLTLF